MRDNLVAAPSGATLAWTVNKHGARNTEVADGPDFQGRRVTPYAGDEAQALTSLSFAPDGRTVVYARGGDHGANWAADGADRAADRVTLGLADQRRSLRRAGRCLGGGVVCVVPRSTGSTSVGERRGAGLDSAGRSEHWTLG